MCCRKTRRMGKLSHCFSVCHLIPITLTPVHSSLSLLHIVASTSASYQWTGNGLLRFFHSKWQVIGYGPYDLDDTSRTKFDWLVTYFEKTPATPAGIDVYVRDPRNMPDSTSKAILERMKALKTKYEQDPDEKRKQLAEELSKLAQQYFDIPHDV